MSHSSSSKILYVLIAIPVLLFGVMFYKSNQSKQQQRDQELQQMKQELLEQQQTLQDQQKELLDAQAEMEKQAKLQQQKDAETQQQLLRKQQELNELKEQKLDDQLQQMESVVTEIKQQQEQEAELRERHKELSEKALKASYMASGLQVASTFKVYVAEYYFNQGQFPSSNKELNLGKPKSYATDAVNSIWVSKGGRITIVYTALSGQDKGAINLVPEFKNESIYWACETKDYEFIQEMMPQCRYLGN